MSRWLCILIGLSLMPLAAARAQVGQEAPQKLERPAITAKEIEESLRTDWYGVYLKGKKIGYFRADRQRQGDLIRDTSTFTAKLLSFGQKAEISITQTMVFEGKAPYRLLNGEQAQQSGPLTQKISLARKDKGFEVLSSTGPEATRKGVPDIDYSLADAMASEVWVRRGPKEKEAIAHRSLNFEDAKVYPVSSRLLSTKTSLVGGVEVRYFEIENESSKEKLKFLTRHDAQGRVLSTNIAIFEIRLETEEQAKNTEFSQDLFVMGMVKIDRPLGLTKKVTELVLELDGKEDDAFEDGPRQSLAKGDNGKLLLRLGKKHGKETKATAKEIEEALAETTTHNINHPKVKALAARAIGDAKSPQEKVKQIVDFAYEFVQPSLSANVPNIHDLMEKKKGDCKSYALLVTNLARASGTPGEVGGLLYIGDDQKAFGGHAWNEVVLDGVWVPVDASLRQTEVDATHLSLGSDHRAAKNLLTTLGKLSFKVVEVKNAD